MKKIALLFSVLFVAFSSCTDDIDDAKFNTSETLLQKIVTRDGIGTYETVFKYDGKKIIEARSVRENKEFIYEGDKISKISWHKNPEAENNLSQYVDFEYYPDGKLKSFKKYLESPLDVEFTYAGEDRVDFVATSTRSTYSFTGYFKVKDNEIAEYVYLNGGTPRPSVEYQYDNKNHPLKNVIGYNKLFLFNYFYSSSHFNGFTTNIGSSKNCISNSLIADPSVVEVMNLYEYGDNDFPKIINRTDNSVSDALFYE